MTDSTDDIGGSGDDSVTNFIKNVAQPLTNEELNELINLPMTRDNDVNFFLLRFSFVAKELIAARKVIEAARICSHNLGEDTFSMLSDSHPLTDAIKEYDKEFGEK